MLSAPTGTISFLFTDIVGSTRLWEKFPAHMGAALARHDALIRQAVQHHNGHVFKTVGDAFCVAFSTPREAVLAAIDAQRALAAESWGEVGLLVSRMGIHTGAAEYRDGDYFGGTLNRTSRIEAAAHGGQILLSQVTCELLEDEIPSGLLFKSLGSHRLRNLDRPEHLFQAVAAGLPENFPPPRSMEVLPNNLPVQTTSFVGREREIEAAQRQIETTRLLTLLGTGGTGKTRLALEVGARLINEFRDGVWLVELAVVTDPDRVVEAVAMAVGAREEPERTLRETLLRFLRDKTLLLILDNCEHVLAATASLSTELLRSCPRLKILAASRHSLGISGEATFPVPPLGMFDTRLHTLTGPDIAEQLSQYEAVKLFIERARAVRPDFVVTNANAPALAEICSRLDGIPLAIELAAARARLLDVGQIAARLDDRFRLLRGTERDGHLPHQQTLKALIDWSYDLLSEPERVLFRRLGVFTGGRTLEAVETVCSGDGLDEHDILDLIQQLLDKSLVSVERESGTPRYTLIESVWQYAGEKLEASGEWETLRNRHLDYYLQFAEKAAPKLEGPHQKEWLDRCQAERFNFRSAIDWAITSQKPEAGFRILSATYRFIEIRGNLKEARATAHELLALPGETIPPRRRADFLIAAGRLTWAADLYEESRGFHEQARKIYADLGHEAGVGLCEMLAGFLDRGDGRIDDAEAHFRRGLEISERVDHSTYLRAGCLSGLGSIALDRGDLATARKLKEDSLVIYEKMGDHWIVGLILWGIVQVAIAQKDCQRAQSALAEWARITLDLGNGWMLPYILDCHAALAVSNGRADHAARVFGAAEVAREHYGTKFSASEQSLHESSLATLKNLLPEKDFLIAWEEGRRTPPWDLIKQSPECAG